MAYEIAEQLQTVNMVSIVVRFLLVTICSGILGFERERRNQAAGFRTYIIVSNASALVMLTNIYISQHIGYTDLVRMPAAVITGLGFLGAGTILVTKSHEVRGLTTAAGLWSVAIIGIAIGAGFYVGGLTCFVVIFFAMEILSKVDKHIGKAPKVATVYCEVDSQQAVGKLIRHIKSNECAISNFEMHSSSCNADDYVSLLFILQMGNGCELCNIVKSAQEIEGVLLVDIL